MSVSTILIVITLSALLVPGGLGSALAAPIPETEPNDTRAQADPAVLGSYSGAIGAPGDRDFLGFGSARERIGRRGGGERG